MPKLGVKSDPVEYRYSIDWLCRLMADEGVGHLQLGSFFELYQLPQAYWEDLRATADRHAVVLDSLFTAHRELGGFFRREAEYHAVARANAERLIQVGAWMGVERVGWNAGAVLRDEPDALEQGEERFFLAFAELLEFARTLGVPTLTLEPMSTPWEPPSTPGQLDRWAERLGPSGWGWCADVSHGVYDSAARQMHSPEACFEACLPRLAEVHLKNTDARCESTFGFGPTDLPRGVIDLRRFRDLVGDRDVVGYLEIGGPKLGRDYSDPQLEAQLRASLAHCREAWLGEPAPPQPRRAKVHPSLMCADPLNLLADVRRLERAGVDALHLDIMDAGFVPNMPLGLEALRALRSKTSLPFDVHLMVEDNDFFIDRFAEIGADWVTVHWETLRHPDRTLSRIRALGMKAGLALNPATPLSVLDWVMDRLDFVLLMTVNPGFAGQELVPSALEKIAACRARTDLPIIVDGNVSFANIPGMIDAGASVLVCGTSSLFHAGAPLEENMARVLSL